MGASVGAVASVVICGVGVGYSMIWCGIVWCVVVWCGVVWCGVVWYGVVWYGMVWGSTTLGKVSHAIGYCDAPRREVAELSR